MIVLTATTDNIQAVLAGSATTNQPQCVTSWRDITTTAFTPGRTVINTNNTTDVNIVAAPAASTQRVVDLINIYNKDTVAATVTVKFDANGTEYILWKGTLAAGESVQYVEGKGWQRLSASGTAQTEMANPDDTRLIVAKTSDYPVVIGDDNKIFTNTGAGGTVKFTLPASAGCTAGKTKFRFVAMDAQIIQIEPPGSDTLGIYNERDSAAQTASSGNPVGTAGTGFEYMDALYMGSGIWHGMGVGRWNV